MKESQICIKTNMQCLSLLGTYLKWNHCEDVNYLDSGIYIMWCQMSDWLGRSNDLNKCVIAEGKTANTSKGTESLVFNFYLT